MPYRIEAECPCCNKKATSLEELETLFGIRKTNKIIPQSYCRRCRSAHCEAGKPCKVKNEHSD